MLYYGAGLFNFLTVLRMVVFFQRHCGVDPWALRFPALLIGLFYIIVTVPMFKRIEFALHASLGGGRRPRPASWPRPS